MVLNLAENAVLLLGLLTLYSLSASLLKQGKIWPKVFMGVLFGGVAIVGMRLAFNYSPGIFYDGRSIILSLGGLFGGGITVLISIIVAGIYRAFIGGNGIWAGLATIVTSGLVGLVFRRIMQARKKSIGIFSLLLFGIIVHIVMLACQLLVKPWPTGVTLVQQIWVPILVIFPIATVLMGMLLKIEDQRIKTQQDLRESKSRYQDLVEKSQDLIYRYRLIPNRKFEFVNHSVESMTGYTVNDFYNNPELITKIIYPDDQPLFIADNKIAITYDQPLTLRWVRKDGGVIWTEIRHTPIYDNEGTLLAVEGISRDITDRKLVELTLKDYNERLEKEVVARTEELRVTQEAMLKQDRLVTMGRLAAGMSHELRNPLGVISNAVFYLNMILPDANEKVKEYLSILEKESHAALQLMTDMLNFATLQTGDRQSTKVNEILDQVFEEHPVPAGVTREVKVPGKLAEVYIDPHQLAHALSNLVVNAYQAMDDKGNLKITVRNSSKAHAGFVSIEIKDTGPGFAAENIQHLYEPLFTTKPRHIGLGLPIAKRLIEVNAGRIEIKSVRGKGAAFVVYLPLKPES